MGAKKNQEYGHAPMISVFGRFVLHLLHMSHTLTFRLTSDLLSWLKETSQRTGVPMGQLVREQLEKAKSNGGRQQKFARHIGELSGPPDLSSRKGYSRQ
jgi:predicted DNA binding CopG/RHH family protein